MLKINSIDELLKLADKNQTVKFTEDVEFHCDIGDWWNQINVKIESTGSLIFLKSVNVICLQAGQDISAGRHISAGRDISAGGSIKAGCDISAGLNIKAGGSISAGCDIKAGCDISAGRHISAGRVISAGCDISSGRYISAGGDISSGRDISAGGDISSGLNIKAEKITAMSVLSQIFEVKCKTLITSRLPFWRQFWAFQLPLLKWKEQILNDRNYWNDLKQLATKKEKEKICNWEGWHPILKAQLQMFFELKTEVNF